MPENPKEEGLTNEEEQIFEDVRNHDKNLYEAQKMTSHTLAGIVYEQANNKTNPLLPRIYFRASAFVWFANKIIKEDTDNYKDPLDLGLHKDLAAMAGKTEREWEKNRSNESWKKDILTEIRLKAKQYLRDKKARQASQSPEDDSN